MPQKASRAAILTVIALSAVAPVAVADIPAAVGQGSLLVHMRSGFDQLATWAGDRPDLQGDELTAYLDRRLHRASAEVVAGCVPFLLDVPLPQGPDLSMLSASPVPGVESSGYGWRDDPFRHHRKFHAGTDFRADKGTPVFAAGGGRVAFSGRSHGYGNAILIDHGGGVLTRYGHLSKIEIETGADVTAGTRIGQVGSTGRSTGPHLHFEIRLEGRPVDPVLAMRVGELQRTAPDLARIFAYGLTPAVQAGSRDAHDRTNQRLASRRPERAGRTKRDRNLW
jgi:hypothetical protein